jgi:uncharacterized delta-60 repeat protein
VLRLAVIAGVAASLALAAAASGAERPGKIETRIAAIPPGNDVQALGVTPDRRIAVAGTTRFGPSWGWVRAYLPTGVPDAGFGEGGEVRFDADYREVAAMAMQPDGRILVGQTGGPAKLHRLNPDGGRDASFGNGGSVDIDSAATAYARLFEVMLQPDGRILVVSAGPLNGPQPVVLRRYLAGGSPDPSFGTDGQVLLPMAAPILYSSVALQSDGRIVLVAAAGDPPLRIARLSTTGDLDASFGRGGVAPIELGRSRWRAEVRQADGDGWRPLILPGGRIRIPVSFGARASVSRVALVGLTAAGHPDARFGRQGLALGPRRPFAGRSEWPRAAVLDTHGGILVAGGTGSTDDLAGDDASIVRRFRPDGSLDLSFGHRGLVRDTLLGGGASLEQRLAVLDAHTVVLAEQQTTPKYQTWNGGAVHTLHAGYDRDDPSISLVAGCRSLRVRITDLSALDSVVVRADGRVVRRTSRKRLRVRLRAATSRVSVRATDLADNTSTRKVRLPRC